jgi:diguanylate cyclase (GGDEF)-like protein
MQLPRASSGSTFLAILWSIAGHHARLAAAIAIRIWTILSVGGLIAVFMLIRTGYSERWSDPSMTLVQIIYAIACNAGAYVLAGEGRGATSSILAVILMFCVFGLSVRQICAVALFALLAFGGAIAYVVAQAPPLRGAMLDLANFGLILVVLAGGTFVTARVQNLRARLRQQKAELERALGQIRHLAANDELTGLLNRRAMNELLDHECRRADRLDVPLSIALLDIDHFKKINDSHGHPAGDTALRRFAETIRPILRAADRLARWGGEEFLLLLPDTDAEQTAELCQKRIVEQIAALRITHEDASFGITVSVGVTQRRAGEPHAETLERADRALYAAKEAGRNRVLIG